MENHNNNSRVNDSKIVESVAGAQSKKNDNSFTRRNSKQKKYKKYEKSNRYKSSVDGWQCVDPGCKTKNQNSTKKCSSCNLDNIFIQEELNGKITQTVVTGKQDGFVCHINRWKIFIRNYQNQKDFKFLCSSDLSNNIPVKELIDGEIYVVFDWGSPHRVKLTNGNFDKEGDTTGISNIEVILYDVGRCILVKKENIFGLNEKFRSILCLYDEFQLDKSKFYSLPNDSSYADIERKVTDYLKFTILNKDIKFDMKKNYKAYSKGRSFLRTNVEIFLENGSTLKEHISKFLEDVMKKERHENESFIGRPAILSLSNGHENNNHNHGCEIASKATIAPDGNGNAESLLRPKYLTDALHLGYKEGHPNYERNCDLSVKQPHIPTSKESIPQLVSGTNYSSKDKYAHNGKLVKFSAQFPQKLRTTFTGDSYGMVRGRNQSNRMIKPLFAKQEINSVQSSSETNGLLKNKEKHIECLSARIKVVESCLKGFESLHIFDAKLKLLEDRIILIQDKYRLLEPIVTEGAPLQSTINYLESDSFHSTYDKLLAEATLINGNISEQKIVPNDIRNFMNCVNSVKMQQNETIINSLNQDMRNILQILNDYDKMKKQNGDDNVNKQKDDKSVKFGDAILKYKNWMIHINNHKNMTSTLVGEVCEYLESYARCLRLAVKGSDCEFPKLLSHLDSPPFWNSLDQESQLWSNYSNLREVIRSCMDELHIRIHKIKKLEKLIPSISAIDAKYSTSDIVSPSDQKPFQDIDALPSLLNIVGLSKRDSPQFEYMVIFNIFEELRRIHEGGTVYLFMHPGNVLINNDEAILNPLPRLNEMNISEPLLPMRFIAPECRNRMEEILSCMQATSNWKSGQLPGGISTAADVYSFGMLILWLSALNSDEEEFIDRFIAVKQNNVLLQSFLTKEPLNRAQLTNVSNSELTNMIHNIFSKIDKECFSSSISPEDVVKDISNGLPKTLPMSDPLILAKDNTVEKGQLKLAATDNLISNFDQFLSNFSSIVELPDLPPVVKDKNVVQDDKSNESVPVACETTEKSAPDICDIVVSHSTVNIPCIAIKGKNIKLNTDLAFSTERHDSTEQNTHNKVDDQVVTQDSKTNTNETLLESCDDTINPVQTNTNITLAVVTQVVKPKNDLLISVESDIVVSESEHFSHSVEAKDTVQDKVQSSKEEPLTVNSNFVLTAQEVKSFTEEPLTVNSNFVLTAQEVKSFTEEPLTVNSNFVLTAQEVKSFTEEPLTVNSNFVLTAQEVKSFTEEPLIVNSNFVLTAQEVKSFTEEPQSVVSDIAMPVQEVQSSREEPIAVVSNIALPVQDCQSCMEEPLAVDSNFVLTVQEVQSFTEEPLAVDSDIAIPIQDRQSSMEEPLSVYNKIAIPVQDCQSSTEEPLAVVSNIAILAQDSQSTFVDSESV